MLLITNNPDFIGDDRIEIVYKDVKFIEILYEVRNYIHSNYKLLTHPLYGNITPTQTNYRSIVIEPYQALDLDSVRLIEDAIGKVENIISKDRPLWDITEEIDSDLRFIDHEIISETLEQII